MHDFINYTCNHLKELFFMMRKASAFACPPRRAAMAGQANVKIQMSNKIQNPNV
jgi:hypothetical protein